ncbi:unnamed protein product [Nippostrongylus brasiliensis]|uniref:Extensin-like n=1 Tax=Nippostrongylus brasiliensis TaxID=27835 RepID=A0A0N4Y5A0_NIPBR|nr:unnamed protein product [Nippostrongylus brasiliensis]
MLDVDLKSPENEAAEKKQLKKKLEGAKGQPEVLSVPLGAPPTYAESKKAAPAAPSPTVSATQDSTATTNTTTAGAAVPAQPPPLTQLKTTTKQPIPPRPTIPPRKSAPAFPVPAKPPTKYVRTPKRTGSNSMSMSQSAGWPQPAPVPRNPNQPGSADSSAAPGTITIY